MKDTIQLSDHFNYKRLFRFTMPNVVMMLFASIYGIVDGLFVSNIVGKQAFTAINLIFPYLMILGTVGFMFGTGGNALISKTFGEGDSKKANQIFSMLVYQTFIVGAILTIAGLMLLRPITQFLGRDGASTATIDIAVNYGSIYIIGVIPFMFQMEFQSLLTTAEKPKLGLVFTVGAGVANMILDALFVGLFGWGVEGAAWASVIGMAIGGFGPLVYFILPNKSIMRVGKWWFGFKEIVKICTNGVSEFMNNISMNIVGMLYNFQLLKYAGEDGVAAYGVLMYFGVVACSEEGFKYLLLRRKTWRSPEFNCQFDGVVYAVFVSLGFALWENIGYVAMYGFSTALARALTAVPGHACFGVFMGAWYGMAKKYDNQGSEAMCRRCRRRAFWLPVMIHGAYDFIASGYTGLVWEFFVFIIVLFILALRKVKKLSAEDEYIDDQGPTFY